MQKHIDICCGLTGLPTGALLTNLNSRGMREDILVIWDGDFGRTPLFQGKDGAGQDGHITGFTMWMAGGRIKAALSCGATDELGYHAVENVVRIRDLQATMLHLLCIDHKRFSFPHQGLDIRPTGVENRER